MSAEAEALALHKQQSNNPQDAIEIAAEDAQNGDSEAFEHAQEELFTYVDGALKQEVQEPQPLQLLQLELKPPLEMTFAMSHSGLVISSLTRTDLDPRLKEGMPLVQVNDDKVTEESAAGLFQFLSAWNELEIGVNQPVTLSFDLDAQLDMSTLEREVTIEHVLREEDLNDVHDATLDDSNIVLRLLNERIQIPVGPTVMIQFCSTCGWDVATAVDLIERTYDEYKDLQESVRKQSDAAVDDGEVPDHNQNDLFPSFPAIVDPRIVAEYAVTIRSRYLGMTVENVKERTVVRGVSEFSEAQEVGVMPDSLLTQVGDIDTSTLSHMETLEALRHATRPVLLKFRVVDPQKLQRRRAEMRALVHHHRADDIENQTRYELVFWIERRLIFVLRLLTLAAGLASQETKGKNGATGTAATNGSTGAKDCDVFVERIASLMVRSIEAVTLNHRREVMFATRMSTIGDILKELKEVVDWSDPMVSLVDKDLRDVICTLLQLDHDYLFAPTSDYGQPHLIIIKLLERMSDDVCRFQTTPLLCRLAGSNSISSRIACADIIPQVYGRLPLSDQLQVRGVLNRLVTDESGYVKAHAVAMALRLLKIVDVSGLHWLIILCEVAAEDEDWTVRLRALDLCLELLREMPPALAALVPLPKSPNSNFDGKSSKFTDMEDPTLRPLSTTLTQASREMHLIQCRMLPVATRLAEDPEPKVRASVGMKSDELCFSMGAHWSAVITDLVMALLRDEDTVVRCETLSALPRVSAALVGMPRAVADKFIEAPNVAMDHGPPGENSMAGTAVSKTMKKIYDSLLPCVVSLQADTNIRTRTILGGVLADMLNLICCLESDQMGREAADRLQKMVVPVIINLLADPDPQVATAILSRLSPLSGRTLNAWTAMIFTTDHLESLMLSLETLSRSASWRTRQAVSCVLPLLVTTCRTVESRERAADLVGPLVSDPVFEVRKTSSYCICRAAACDFVELNGDVALDGLPLQDMGRMWLDGVVLPQLETMRTSNKFNDRIIALHMIATLLSERLIGEDDVRCDILLQLALTLSNDAVPNVRLALARALLEVTPLIVHKLKLRAPIARELEEVVGRLGDDRDRDTKYFASLIIEKLNTAQS